MRLRVDPTSPEPIFEQLVFRVKEAIAQGSLAGGDRLPSVRELARDASINPNTVARAYEALEAEGVIVRRQGSGCFVTEKGSALATSERKRRLDALVQRLVTEGFHLGFGARELRDALAERLSATPLPPRRDS
ncbi:MAG: GntR family transcriptional regulator [Planctomycetes bacterium]|nr:GntR family transcriptional regulator [Planctomycetota bacterium]